MPTMSVIVCFWLNITNSDKQKSVSASICNISTVCVDAASLLNWDRIRKNLKSCLSSVAAVGSLSADCRQENGTGCCALWQLFFFFFFDRLQTSFITPFLSAPSSCRGSRGTCAAGRTSRSPRRTWTRHFRTPGVLGWWSPAERRGSARPRTGWSLHPAPGCSQRWSCGQSGRFIPFFPRGFLWESRLAYRPHDVATYLVASGSQTTTSASAPGMIRPLRG